MCAARSNQRSSTETAMSKRGERRGRQRRRKPSVASAPQSRTPEQAWSRAGAHNIAGVSFQIAVTAKLLGGALADELGVARATPEGFEDIDLELRDGARVLVQVKERAPAARFGRSDLTEAMSKKKVLLTEDANRRFVLVTDATLGGGLAATGWEQSLADALDQSEIDALAARLEPEFGDPAEIVARTQIVQVERNVVDSTRRELAELRIAGKQPSVAVLVYARLIEKITEVAVRQRSTSPDTAEWIAPSDLEALVQRVVETVDLESLDETIRAGIVEPVDFSVKADLSVEEFLAGVDVLPSHIAADLVLPRPTEEQALTDALSSEHSALLAAPSGAGKSALLWRTARELSGRARPYRLRRLLPEDVPAVTRWVRLQEPSEHYPLLLCADNLGRPSTAGWSELAREFIDTPGVLLLGACREEDYRPGLAVGRTTIVNPTLDRDLAAAIAEALTDRDIDTAVDVAEAFEASEGLLMEFLSMLLTGRRLRQVVEEQVEARLSEDRVTEREILRYVATAHAAGVAIPAEVLEALLPGEDLTAALTVLASEHLVVTDDGNRWRGLHELRSEVARDYLHRFPPPTAAATVQHLVANLPVADARRIVETYARLDEDLAPAAEAVSVRLGAPDIRAGDSAQLVESLAMADAIRHARTCLEVIETHRPRSLDPWNAFFLAYLHRFGGVALDGLTAIEPGFVRFLDMASALPPPPRSLREVCLQRLPPEAVNEIATRGTVGEAAAWLESLEGCPTEPTLAVEAVWVHFAGWAIDVDARLSATLRALAAPEGADRLDELLGTHQDRMQRLATELPDCVSADTTDEPDGTVVSLHLLVPEDDTGLHERSVQTCRIILDLCPEADFAEVTVLTPNGDRYAIGDVEEGYKRIQRSRLPRATQTKGNTNALRAARLLLASRYWTQPLRALSDASRQLLTLREEAVAWLINPNHNTKRRRRAVTFIDSLVADLAAQPSEALGQGDSGGGRKGRDAINEALTVVRDVAAAESADDPQQVALGSRCRKAVQDLIEARQGELPRLSTAGDPLPDALDDMLGLLGDVLLVYAEGREVPFKPLRRLGSESWTDVAHRLVREAASGGYEAERGALEEALGVSAGWELRRVEHVDARAVRFLTDRWVVVVGAESDNPDPLAFADRLQPELAEELAFRTLVVFGAGGRFLPLSALKLGTSGFWPADDDDVVSVAAGLGIDVLTSVHLQACDVFITELVRASRAAAAARLRRAAELPSDDEAPRMRYESARRALEACDTSLHDEGARLLDRVEREQSGNRQTLAGEWYRSVTHNEQSDDVAALVALRVAALAVDL